MNRIYPFSHSPIDCYFNPSPRDFVIEEIPLYAPSGEGEHCLIYIRKKGLSTFELLSLLASILGCKAYEIGYAGLKDKAATTYQYISIHRSLLPKLENAASILQERQVKILNIAKHHNKLRIGHLKGNRFFVRLKKCTPLHAQKLHCTLSVLTQSGFPNYFGKQRFGRDGRNFEEGKTLAKMANESRNKKLDQFLISAYQSYLFNMWLACRVQLSQMVHFLPPNEALKALKNAELEALKALSSHCDTKIVQALQAQKQHFVLLEGDVMGHYPFGKLFINDDTKSACERFMQRDIAPMGALSGKKLTPSSALSLVCEKPYLDVLARSVGSRRYAWVWAEDIEGEYIAQKAHFELRFSLPKGAYGTIFLEALLGIG